MTEQAKVPFPPALPFQLGLTTEEMNQVTEIIEASKREHALSVAEQIEMLVGITLADNPRDEAMYLIRESYNLLIRAVAYRVMAHVKGGGAGDRGPSTVDEGGMTG